MTGPHRDAARDVAHDAPGDALDNPMSPAVRRIVDEVLPGRPNIDWARLEASLFDEAGEVRAKRHPTRATRGLRITQFAASLAVAAAFAVALGSPARPQSNRAARRSSPRVETPGAPLIERTASHTARVLHVGDRLTIEDPAGEVVVAEGRLEAHLARGSRLRVVDVGERIHLALDAGSLTAAVVPVPGGEPFAVDVGSQRVAVHGTRLQISVFDGSFTVAVAEGSAVLGLARGSGRTEGALIPEGTLLQSAGGSVGIHYDRALAQSIIAEGLGEHTAPIGEGSEQNAQALPKPAQAISPSWVASSPNSGVNVPLHAVAAGGANVERISPTVEATGGPEPAATAKAVEGAEPAKAVETAGAPAELASIPPKANPKAPPNGLTDAQMEPTFMKIRRALSSCVPSTTAGVTFTIESAMTLTITNGGALSDVSFEPPLNPTLRECVRVGISTLKFPSAKAPSILQRKIVLGGN
ncbi:MAG: hypothetical protein NVSMB1_03740 [Polyangiales bacterium]